VALASGELYRKRPVIIGPPRVRAAPVSTKERVVVDVLAKNSGDGVGKSAKKSRTDVWREEREAALAAKGVAIGAAARSTTAAVRGDREDRSCGKI
jgi:hypothetical protein